MLLSTDLQGSICVFEHNYQEDNGETKHKNDEFTEDTKPSIYFREIWQLSIKQHI